MAHSAELWAGAQQTEKSSLKFCVSSMQLFRGDAAVDATPVFMMHATLKWYLPHCGVRQPPLPCANSPPPPPVVAGTKCWHTRTDTALCTLWKPPTSAGRRTRCPKVRCGCFEATRVRG